MSQWMKPAVAGLLLIGSFTACKKNDASASGAIDTTAAVKADTTAPAASTATPTPSTPAPDASAWASTTVLGYTAAANDGEIQLGKLGEKKATSPAVKAFARQMVTDHTAMMNDGKKLAKKLSATPDTAANDVRDLSNHGRDELKELTDKAAGADWDKNYMDKMVSDHQAVLGKLQDAAKNTTDADVRKALESATGKVQAHLTKAQDIQSKLK